MAAMQRTRILSIVLVLAAGSVALAPSGDSPVTEEQLEYSKKMFAEGEAAMEAGDFATALTKFQEGYRYAPHLHVFTFNIATAADKAGDCTTAFDYFRRFLDLVPEHPEREGAQARYDELQTSCRPEDPPEAVESAPSAADRARDRDQNAPAQTYNEAYASLRTALQMYDAAKMRFPDEPFAKAARRKRKHAKKLAKVAGKLGITIETNAFDTLEVPGTVLDACRVAEKQEGKIAEAMEAALEHHGGGPAYRALNRALRGADRDQFAFDECS